MLVVLGAASFFFAGGGSAGNDSTAPAWRKPFLEMLPAIQRQARIAFRHLDPEARGEAVQEVVTYATSAFKALWHRGTPELAYPSVLALHGIKRVKIGCLSRSTTAVSIDLHPLRPHDLPVMAVVLSEMLAV